MKRKILIVDDDPKLRKNLFDILRDKDYAPITASTGKEALSKIKKETPAVALIDLRLEDISGLKVMKGIRERCPDTQCIVLTGYASTSSAIETVKLGAYSYFQKPYDMEQLLLTIRRAIEKREAEEALKRTSSEWKITFDSVEDLIMLLDLEYRIIRANLSTSRFLHLGFKEIIGKKCSRLFHKMDVPLEICPLRKMKHTKKAEESEMLLSEKGVWILSSASPVLDDKGNLIGAVCIIKDITERKGAEEEIRSSREQLRNLVARLQSIREEERMLIAREIHDELGQTLTVLKMDLFWLAKRMPKDQRPFHEKTKSMSKLIDKTMQRIKRISAQLRPGLLDYLGLPAAVEWEGEEFQNRTGIKCEVNIDSEDIIMEQDRSTAIFRIFQETLTNAARHANAKKIKVSLKEKAGKLELRVRDNGKGITEKQISDPKSFGLIGMRERAQFLGGEVKIMGVQDKGTTITTTVPLPQKGKPNDKNTHR